MNKFKLIIIGICAIGLAACGEVTVDESNGDKITVSDVETELNKISEEVNDLSEFPTGVQNGVISMEYYNALMTYYNSSDKFESTTQQIEAETSISQDERLKKHVSANNTHIATINGIEHTPSNDVEREIDKYFTEVLFYDESLSNNKAKYYSTKDEMYYDIAESNLVSWRQSSLVLAEIMNKYELFK